MQLIPSPPTDNLYKFLALAGVVAFLFFIALIIRDHEQTRSDAVAQAELTLKLGLHFEELQDEALAFINTLQRTERSPFEMEILNDVEKRLQDTSFFIGTSTKPNQLAPTDLGIAIGSMAHFFKLADDERTTINQMRKTHYSLLSRSYEIGAASAAAKLRIEATSPIRITIYILAIASFLSAAAGFRLWYTRVQKFQDALLRKECEELDESDS